MNHKTSKQQNSPDSFNKLFLSIPKKLVIILNIVVGKITALIIHHIERLKELLTPWNKKKHGYDKISTTILKASASFISSTLNYICNKSITSGTFLTQL